MSTFKYDPLGSYLYDSNMAYITLHFNEIDKILGTQLPPCLSSNDGRKKLLWNNNIRNYATRSWLEAGYVFVGYSIRDASVTFKRDLSEAERYLHKK